MSKIIVSEKHKTGVRISEYLRSLTPEALKASQLKEKLVHALLFGEIRGFLDIANNYLTDYDKNDAYLRRRLCYLSDFPTPSIAKTVIEDSKYMENPLRMLFHGFVARRMACWLVSAWWVAGEELTDEKFGEYVSFLDGIELSYETTQCIGDILQSRKLILDFRNAQIRRDSRF